jgi:membrane protein
MAIADLWHLSFAAGEKWSADSASRLAAALSFYTVLSLAPILVLAVMAASLFLPHAQNEIVSQVSHFFGEQSAKLIAQIVTQSRQESAGPIATALSVVVTFFSASNIFLQIDDAMNVIWGLTHKGSFLQTLIVTRLVAFLGVVLFGIVSISWLVLQVWIRWLSVHAAGYQMYPVLSFLMTLVILILGFAMFFKAMPKNQLQWGDVWLASIVSALGFSFGQELLSMYFAFASVSAAYGAAGTIVVVLLWTYYMSQIYLFGAELAYVYAHRFGSLRSEPEANPVVGKV